MYNICLSSASCVFGGGGDDDGTGGARVRVLHGLPAADKSPRKSLSHHTRLNCMVLGAVGYSAFYNV